MKLKIIGTGSKGNAYLLENEEEALLIECGVNIKEIKKAIDFNVSKIVGCIVTHEHNDHAKSIKEVMSAGIDVYASYGTHGTCKTLNKSRTNIILEGYPRMIGNFNVLAFKINHDASEPLGFLINHRETGNVLFLTDTFYSNYTFKGLNNIIIEANYSKEIIKEKLSEKEFLKDRIFQSHMSIDTCLEFLNANDLSKVNNIVLIHLSDGNSNEVQFKEAVENQTGKSVYVASNGMEIEFNKTPF